MSTDNLEQRLRDAFEASAAQVTPSSIDTDREHEMRELLAQPTRQGQRPGVWAVCGGLAAAAVTVGVIALSMDGGQQPVVPGNPGLTPVSSVTTGPDGTTTSIPPTTAPGTTKQPGKVNPGGQPTGKPGTGKPSGSPTTGPTESPTTGPTESPTTGPTESPTTGPTESPTTGPTESPTTGPTESPTTGPTESPTDNPTTGPSPTATDLPSTGEQQPGQTT